MINSDYCFISKFGKVLAEESLSADQVGSFAQRLARKYQTTIHIWIAGGEPVEPDKCPNCQEIMPEVGPCWCSSFGEEGNWIPFDGRPMEPKVITESDEYF